jgi:hypothetical protein
LLRIGLITTNTKQSDSGYHKQILSGKMSKAATEHPLRLDDDVAKPLEASLNALVDQSVVTAGEKDQAARK